MAQSAGDGNYYLNYGAIQITLLTYLLNSTLLKTVAKRLNKIQVSKNKKNTQNYVIPYGN